MFPVDVSQVAQGVSRFGAEIIFGQSKYTHAFDVIFYSIRGWGRGVTSYLFGRAWAPPPPMLGWAPTLVRKRVKFDVELLSVPRCSDRVALNHLRFRCYLRAFWCPLSRKRLQAGRQPARWKWRAGRAANHKGGTNWEEVWTGYKKA